MLYSYIARITIFHNPNPFNSCTKHYTLFTINKLLCNEFILTVEIKNIFYTIKKNEIFGI